jgi:TPR repeat protein
MLTLNRLLLTASMCCLIATANAAPLDDAIAAHGRGDYAQALKIFRSLADQGDASAQYNIGVMYHKGQGVTQNNQEAVKWLKLSAVQGLRYAQSNLGYMYLNGYGVTQDHQEALKLFRLAAAQGDTMAQTNIGWMYHMGQGVTQNYQEALKWYRLAAAQGNDLAHNNIGMMYHMGQGVTQDHQEALKWYRLAAAQGDATAIENLKLPQMLAAAARQSNGSQYSSNSNWQPVDDPQLLQYPIEEESQQPPRSTSVKTGTQQEEQVSIKTNRKTEQTRRTATRTEAPERTSPPKLVFNSSSPKSDGTVELSGRVISDASISEISINGRALEVYLGRDNSFKVTRLPPMGVVTSYRLSVSDEYGQKAEKEINVERAAIQYAEQVAPLNPRKLKAQTNPNAVALIIGIEAYSRLPQAQYADSDATHFYDYANQSLGVPPHKIKLLTDTKANRIDLLLAMRSWMKTEVNGKSDVYIFFAGHGLASPDGSKTYLLPADGDRDLLDETSILRDDLIASAKGAKTITMFLDTCYSGGTRTNEILLADARPIAIVPDKSALPSNVTVLAAASGAQLSSTYEAAQQGLFSYWLMKGLEGDADTNKDKKITTGELHEYVVKQVGPMAQRRNRQQDPQLMGDSTRVLVSY